MPTPKKNVVSPSRRLEAVSLLSPISFLYQIKCEPYRTELPNFLLSVLDQIIKADPHQLLRHTLQPLAAQESLQPDQEAPTILWLFTDPFAQNHILSHPPHPLILEEKPMNQLEGSTLMLEQSLPTALACSNVLNVLLDKQAMLRLQDAEVVSLDEIRLRCQANSYTDPKVLWSQLVLLVSWYQVFRARSLQQFQYISTVYQKIVVILDKRDFFKRFCDLKLNDLARLMREEVAYKVDTTEWPIIPTSFREYEEIDQYVPSPPSRQDSINQRMKSQKMPLECGPDCVCLAQNLPEGKSFCTYSLIHGWETNCPNRSRKIECQHKDPEEQMKCRNSEIQKSQRKKCKKEGDTDGQIEERIAWGIDLYTRNVLYHCLPEIDITNKEKTANDVSRNTFIEHTLVKAFNLLATQGYSIVEVCNFIKKQSQYNAESNTMKKSKLESEQAQKEETTLQGKPSHNQEWLFTCKDWEYADLLLRNYELAEDKTAFRIHTKGKGAICIDTGGIGQGTFLIQYFGQIYEPWRWYDREDLIKEIMKKKKVKYYMPEFYNIALEKHPDEPLGCDMLMVDPSRKGNFSSRFSHSCDPNCGTIITVSNGNYYIGMYAFKDIVYGEELTFDYCSMTESSYQHFKSVCLCGMKKCRGFYLQLSNTKMFSNLMDTKNCFFTRNSAILKADSIANEQQYAICSKYNIKTGFLQDSPKWLVQWIASVLVFIEEEGEVYQMSLIKSWQKEYPWQNAESVEEKEENIKRYSLTSRLELESIRFQNLLTSVDKIKYFYSRNEENQNPPIFPESHSRVLDVLIFKDDSVLKQLQDNLIRYKLQELPTMIETFLTRIKAEPNIHTKLSLFRLCCLIVSHRLLLLGETTFNNELLSDIVFFYAFTHTYFSPNEFQSFETEEINISVSEILGENAPPNERRERSYKKYASPFVWGQMASWYKQTIVSPEASLSQDRRGTLSYPLIRSIMRSEYPYEKKSRAYFFKMLKEKPANSWPPARGCDLSFKNPYKLYGTLLFENVHSRDRLAGLLVKDTLLESCLSVIYSPLRQKLDLFKKVEGVLGGLPEGHPIYELIEFGGDMDHRPVVVKSQLPKVIPGEPRKRVKRDQNGEQ